MIGRDPLQCWLNEKQEQFLCRLFIKFWFLVIYLGNYAVTKSSDLVH
jgi:hypothetical protein